MEREQEGGGGGDAPSIPNVRLRGLRELEPYTQGRLDGTCGLYAIVNAIRLIAIEHGQAMTWDQSHALFRHGASYLNDRGKLNAALRYGVAHKLWVKLIAELAFKAAKLLRLPISVDQPFKTIEAVSLDTMIEIVRFSIRERRAVLVLLRGAYEHYSVIGGVTATRFQLFDSYGYHWISLSRCGVGDAPARHQIHVRSLTVLGL